MGERIYEFMYWKLEQRILARTEARIHDVWKHCIIFCQVMKPGFANISRENSCTVKSLSCQIKGELGTLAFFYPISCHNISILLSHFLLIWNDFSSSFQPLFGCMLTQNQVFVYAWKLQQWHEVIRQAMTHITENKKCTRRKNHEVRCSIEVPSLWHEYPTCFSSREELVSSLISPGFFGAPFDPAAGIHTSYQKSSVRLLTIHILIKSSFNLGLACA